MACPADVTPVIEHFAGDLLTLAQCVALDATVFPQFSLSLFVGSRSCVGDELPLGSTVWVARPSEGGRVDGFLSALRAPLVLDIVGLAVDPERRRLGIGRALLQQAIAAAEHARAMGGGEGCRLQAIVLHVSTANRAAIALYESEGFRVAQRLDRFYSSFRFADDGDAYRMIRSLG